MPERAVILLVDDLPEDILLIRKALEKAAVLNPIYALNSGEETILYLKGGGKYSNRDEYPLPDLLLLDLKMPVMSGFEVLRWIRQEPGLSAMRVIVLTGSDHLRDVNQAYQLGANSFMVKPTDFQDFVNLARSVESYWFHHSKTPELSRDPKLAATLDPRAPENYKT